MFWKMFMCGCVLSTSSEEHLFELVLPKPCNVGHIDVKFCFNSLCTASPNIQASCAICYLFTDCSYTSLETVFFHLVSVAVCSFAYSWLNYRVGHKNVTLVHIFANYWPVFKIFLLTHSADICSNVIIIYSTTL